MQSENLIAAVKAVLAQWDTPNWKITEPTAKLMADLRKAVDEAALHAAEPVMYVSEQQLAQCVGHYVPSRKTAEGNFQLALYRAPPTPSVAVKALEWIDLEASMPFGLYRVEPYYDTDNDQMGWRWHILVSGLIENDTFYGKFCSTPEEAKVDAQRDFTARSRSSHVTDNAPPLSVIVKTLEWKPYGSAPHKWTAGTPFGEYVIDLSMGIYWEPGNEDRPHQSDAPKAAAQAHWEACIRSTLSGQVQDVAEDVYIAADDVSGTSGAWVQQGSYTGDVDVHRFGALQEGWQLVPDEPTEEMVDSVISMIDDEAPHPFIINLYRAMLAAAPAKQEG